jgi:hypothetical protein
MPSSPHVGQHFRSVGLSEMAGEEFDYFGVWMVVVVEVILQCSLQSTACLGRCDEKGKVGQSSTHGMPSTTRICNAGDRDTGGI